VIGDVADWMLCCLQNAIGYIEPRLCHRKQARLLSQRRAILDKIKARSREAPILRVLAFGTQGIEIHNSNQTCVWLLSRNIGLRSSAMSVAA
jgi:hypothetical protein